MNSYDMQEWLKLILRWTHVVAAITWIGQTYLFNWMETHLRSDEKTRDNVSGSLWMVHGGGFYWVEKLKVPEEMPRRLHWFKWEAAITWLSGVVLLVLVYYLGGLLVEPEDNFMLAVAAGIGSLVLGWVVYDLLMIGPLGKKPVPVAIVFFILIAAVSYSLNLVLSPRAAYIHMGAVFATIMAANVWLRILPAQTKMLAATARGEVPDPALRAVAPLRSRQNTYMSVPVVFIMISNHFPTISYGHRYNWAVLSGLVLLGWLVSGRLFVARPQSTPFKRDMADGDVG